MKNFLPIFGIELQAIQTNSKSSENISWINIIQVLEFKKEKKVMILSILLLVLLLFTVTYFFFMLIWFSGSWFVSWLLVSGNSHFWAFNWKVIFMVN